MRCMLTPHTMCLPHTKRSYFSAVALTARCLTMIVTARVAVLQDPPPKMIVTDVTPSAVFISARVWVKPDDMGGAPFAVREAIIERFNRHGVPISHWRTAEVGKAIEQLDEAGVLPGLGASLDGSRADASGRVRKGAALEGSSEAADDEGIVLMAAQSLQSSI